MTIRLTDKMNGNKLKEAYNNNDDNDGNDKGGGCKVRGASLRGGKMRGTVASRSPRTLPNGN